MQSKAKTPTEYLTELSPERKKAISTLRATIKKHLPKGYKEMMLYGMITYVVPLSMYPKGYLDNPKMPLSYAALASQKNYLAVYLSNIYTDKKNEKWLREEFKKSGKKLDMGKSCIRFKKLEDAPLEIIGKAVSLTTPQEYIEMYEKGRKKTR